MNTTSPKMILERLNAVMSAWETLRPQSTFGGMTLDQFRTAVQPSLDSRSRLIEALNTASSETTKRRDADAHTVAILKRVVSGVKADADAGEDSDIYKAMGFVRISERRSGLTRRSRTPAPEVESVAAK